LVGAGLAALVFAAVLLAAPFLAALDLAAPVLAAAVRAVAVPLIGGTALTAAFLAGAVLARFAGAVPARFAGVAGTLSPGLPTLPARPAGAPFCARTEEVLAAVVARSAISVSISRSAGHRGPTERT
jgi:hypothetical protein